MGAPVGSEFVRIANELGELVAEKNRVYGNSFGESGKIVRILYPEGVPPEKLEDFLVVIRMIDKMFRIATARDALGEDPFRDIMGYALLATERNERERSNCKGE